MTREQAEQIARKHFAGADCTRELQRAVNAIMEAAAIERADEREACAKVCDAQIDIEERAKSESRAIRDRDSVNELDSLRHAQAVRLYNAAVTTCADAIRARGER